MEAAPPSYHNATVNNLWNIVAPYLERKDLLAATRVSQEWHRIFTPHLWGNPAVHFRHTADEDAAFNLNAFLQALTNSRTSVTSCTHTICVPRSQAHDEPHHSSWLQALLHRLPHLQSLVTRSQGSFDHEALVAIKFARGPSAAPTGPFGLALRLLDASYCWNATPTGLTDALQRLQQLLYLDLSGTSAARDHRVLSQMFHIHELKVLKLRSVALTDLDLKLLVENVQTKIKSLDLRHNKLTDASAQILVDSCYAIDIRQDEIDHDGTSSLRTLGLDMLRVFQGYEFETHLRRSLTAGFAPRFVFEGIYASGVTHLYLSDNRMSISGCSTLLTKPQLHVLDIGQQSPRIGQVTDWSHLIKTLHQMPNIPLTALRVDHSLVTAEIPSEHSSALSMNTPHDNHDSTQSYRRTLIPTTCYHPLLLPNLRLLCLTSLPSLSPVSSISTSLCSLVSALSHEAHLSLLAATQDWSRPPGSLHAAAKSLFGMETLVLEVSSTEVAAASDHPDTGDLWRNARGDFSFFDGEGVEGASKEGWVDNVAVLASARREATTRWKRRGQDGYVPGYWEGDIKVRRDPDEQYAWEMEDYLATRGDGNTFG